MTMQFYPPILPFNRLSILLAIQLALMNLNQYFLWHHQCLFRLQFLRHYMMTPDFLYLLLLKCMPKRSTNLLPRRFAQFSAHFRKNFALNAILTVTHSQTCRNSNQIPLHSHQRTGTLPNDEILLTPRTLEIFFGQKNVV